MKKAGAIIRVSTARQLEGTSPDKQIEAISMLAGKQGYELIDEHIWQLAESGGARDRAGFREALKAAERGDVQRVYVFSIDRLGRNLLEMLLFLRDLDDLGIDCWSAEKSQQLRGDDFIFQIEGAVASKERQEIIKRTQDGLLRAIKAGKYSGGIIAYGYRLDPDSKQLLVEESESAIVRQMFEWCIEEQISCVQIAERLNAMRVPTRYSKDGRSIRRQGKRDPEKTAGIWRAGRIANMLKNPAYMGKWEWGKRSGKRKPNERIKGFCPPIVSEEMFCKAGEVLRSNQLFSTRNGHRDYLLRGLIKCGNCGRTYCGSYSRVGNGRRSEKRYYRCNGKTQWRKLGITKCLSQNLKADEIEAIVWEDIKAFCKNPQVVIEQLKAQRKPDDDHLVSRIEEVNLQIGDLERKETRLLRIAAESQEVNINALDALLAENRQSLDTLKAYKNSLESKMLEVSSFDDELVDVAERLSSLGTRIDQASFEERRRAIGVLVKEINVTQEKNQGKIVSVITITYRFNDPCSIITPPWPAVVQNYTPVHAGITATR
jgi:site-specific DNA recombinase